MSQEFHVIFLFTFSDVNVYNFQVYFQLKKLKLRNAKMLASDSDSEIEYPADANDSDASSDFALKGQLALGIDPEVAKTYDGRSAPLNGSQYLMMVMKEKKTTPKVAFADASKLPVKNMSHAGGTCDDRNNSPEEHSFLEAFLKKCSMMKKDSPEEASQAFNPLKWREDVVSKFSVTRTKVEHWNYRIQSRGLLLRHGPSLPPNNENLHWLRFCYGLSFSKLAASQKSRAPDAEEKLRSYFLDLYDEVTSNKLLSDDVAGGEIVVTKPVGVHANENEDTSSSTDSVSSADEAAVAQTKSEKSTSAPPSTLGHKPVMSILMRLNQTQLENLIKWNLAWLKTYGFVNQCQGQWIYALFACLPKPIDPSVMSDLREIARVLINLRGAECWRAMMDKEEGECVEELFDFINSLNLLVYIVTDYFQQKDLVMKL